MEPTKEELLARAKMFREQAILVEHHASKSLHDLHIQCAEACETKAAKMADA